MLKEFAFTPQVFDPDAAPNNPRWRECIRALAIGLFSPRVVPIVVSGLHSDGRDCTWEQAAFSTVQGIADQSLRLDAQQLLQRLTVAVVNRPQCCDWPGEAEPAWGKEAADSHSIEPLDRVVAQVVANVPTTAPRAGLASAESLSFWDILKTEAPAPTSLTEDVRRLRPVLIHSDSLIISAPYESTTEFAMECVRQAARRGAGFRSPQIVVHQESPLNPLSRMDWIRRQLPGIAGRAIASWVFWPKDDCYRERCVLGGRLALTGGGHVALGVRWGVSMTHVWGEGNPATAEPTTYTLLSPVDGRRHQDAIDQRMRALNLTPIPL